MNEAVHPFQSSFPGCLKTQHDEDLHLVPAFNILFSYPSWQKMCVKHRNKTLDSCTRWTPAANSTNTEALNTQSCTYNTSIFQTGTAQVFHMLIYKSLPQRFCSCFSDNVLPFTSSELVIGKHYSPGPQSRPLQCYPPSKSMRGCCSLELYLPHHDKLWRRGPGTLCSWWILCSAEQCGGVMDE